MLKQRIITALLLLPVALGGFFLLDGANFALFIGAVVTLGGWEWARLAGLAAQPRSCWLDEVGRVYLDTDRGFGLVHTLDVGCAADAVEQGLWQPQEAAAATLPGRFGFVASPAQLQRELLQKQ